jgi:hypothetical protein
MVSDDIMEGILKPDTTQKRTELDVLKELFDTENPETKTELSVNQIILINQKRMIAKMLGFTSLNFALTDFMKLQISLNRRGRGEFVDGFKSNRDHEVEKMGFFGNIKDKMGLK